MTGCWEYEKMEACNLPQRAATAFSKAMEGIVGVGYVPVLFVAHQLVSGTNYCFICQTTTVTNPPLLGCKSVFIYETLDGNCSIQKIHDIIS